MGERKYRWNLDRLVALLIALGNILIAIFIIQKFINDNQFLRIHTGLDLSFTKGQSLVGGLIVLSVVLLCNYLFLQKNYKIWMLLGLCQTLIFAFAIRNIFLIFLYEKSIDLSLVQNIIVLFYMGGLIYLTLFSSHVMTYFKLKRRRK